MFRMQLNKNEILAAKIPHSGHTVCEVCAQGQPFSKFSYKMNY